jgi:hypothetical protein
LARMIALSEGYQEQRPQLETPDINALVIRALLKCITSGLGAEGEDCEGSNESTQLDYTHNAVLLSASDITEEAIAIVKTTDQDIKQDYINIKRITTILRKQRFELVHKIRANYWHISVPAVVDRARAYGVELPKHLDLRYPAQTSEPAKASPH